MYGERIRSLRKNKGYSQEQLSRKLHVSQSAISQWEKEITTPSLDQLNALAQLFDTSVDDIIGSGKPDEKPKVLTPRTTEARILAAGIDRMPAEDRRRALRMMEVMFEQYKEFFEGD